MSGPRISAVGARAVHDAGVGSRGWYWLRTPAALRAARMMYRLARQAGEERGASRLRTVTALLDADAVERFGLEAVGS